MNVYVLAAGIGTIFITMLLMWLLTKKVLAKPSTKPHTFFTPIFWSSGLIGSCISYLLVGNFVLGLCLGMGVGVLTFLLVTGALKKKWMIGSMSGLIVGLIAMAFQDGVLVFVLLLLSGISLGIAWQFFDYKKHISSVPSSK
jgi:hypothetical protein